MLLSISAITDRGNVRAHNEDRVLLGIEVIDEGRRDLQVDLAAEGGKFFVALADGMGGHGKGEVAAEMVLRLLSSRMRGLEAGLTEEDLAGRVRAFSLEVHEKVLEEGQKYPGQAPMGTTLVAVLFYGGAAYYINVGDSRLYRYRDGYLVQVSQDQSVKAIFGGPSHAILNCFGGGARTVDVDFGPVGRRLLDGDVLLLCSDGLSDVVREDEMEKTLTEAGDPVGELLRLARERGGPDNISIVLIRVAREGEGT